MAILTGYSHNLCIYAYNVFVKDNHTSNLQTFQTEILFRL